MKSKQPQVLGSSPELLTMSEAAEICRVSIATIQREIKRGKLRVHSFTRRRQRIDRADLNRYIAGSLIPISTLANSVPETDNNVKSFLEAGTGDGTDPNGQP